MPNEEITDFTELATTPAAGDQLVVVDVSDTTDAPTGTTKRIAYSNLVTAGGDASTNTSTSVDSEITLFSGTGGKTLKRATTSGVLKGTSGVIGQAGANDLASPVYAADAGSTDAYAITLSPAPGSYQTGALYRFKANTANTGACTIDINSLGAKTIKKVAGGITTDLSDNDIRVGQFVDLVYDGTNMQMQSTMGNAGGGGSPGGSSGDIQYNNGGAFGGAPLVREDADTVALYDTSNTSENPSRLNIYGQKNGADYERLSIGYDTTNDLYYLDSNKGGASTARRLHIYMGGTNYWRINTTGSIYAQDNTNSVISSGTGSASSPGFQFGTTGSSRGMFQDSNNNWAYSDANSHSITFSNGIYLKSNGGLYFSSTGTPNGSNDASLVREGTNRLAVKDGSTNFRDLSLRTVCPEPDTYANRPGTPRKGMIICVTDSTVNTWGATVAGGGANSVLAWYNGTNWTVIGV